MVEIVGALIVTITVESVTEWKRRNASSTDCRIPAVWGSTVDVCCQENIAPVTLRHSVGFVVLSFNEIALLIKVHLACIGKIDLISPTPSTVRMSVEFPPKSNDTFSCNHQVLIRLLGLWKALKFNKWQTNVLPIRHCWQASMCGFVYLLGTRPGFIVFGGIDMLVYSWALCRVIRAGSDWMLPVVGFRSRIRHLAASGCA